MSNAERSEQGRGDNRRTVSMETGCFTRIRAVCEEETATLDRLETRLRENSLDCSEIEQLRRCCRDVRECCDEGERAFAMERERDRTVAEHI